VNDIDILIPIFEPDLSNISRLYNCLEALNKNKYNFNTCIVETSFEKRFIGFIDKLNIRNPKYIHLQRTKKIDGVAESLNFGYKNLVKSDPFIILYPDFVVDKNFIEGLLYHIEKAGFEFYKAKYTHNDSDARDRAQTYEELIKVAHVIFKSYGDSGMIYSRNLYESVNGNDEEYVGWGKLDYDFGARAFLYNKEKGRKVGYSIYQFYNMIENTELRGIHQPHERQGKVTKEQAALNNKLFTDKVELYDSGERKYYKIKGLKDLRR